MESRVTIETNLQEIVSQIFNAPPKEPCSIGLELDMGDDDVDIYGIFEVMSQVLVYGAKLKYEKDLTKLSENELNTLHDYMKSMGFDFSVNSFEFSSLDELQKSKRQLSNPPKLEDFGIKLVDRENCICHDITLSFYQHLVNPGRQIGDIGVFDRRI